MLCLAEPDHHNNSPNILLIITDNQPPMTIGAYGNPEIVTPNIDKLAKEGFLFKNAFATNGMCSPTRASILTGLMPSQHGVHTWLNDRTQKWPANWSAINEFRTLPATLADHGYDTALIGKFHLGSPLKPQLKFQYWVTFPFGETESWTDSPIIDNGKQYIEHENLTDFWTKKAIEYIDAHKSAKKPFFLYLAYNAPYGLPPAMNIAQDNPYLPYYAKSQLLSFPRHPMNKMFFDFIMLTQSSDVAKSPYGAWVKQFGFDLLQTYNNPNAMRNYAAQITLLDHDIGKVLAALQANGLAKNTLVIFMTDQGLAYGQKGFWGQSDQSYPANLYDAEVRIPLIFRQPGIIKPNQTSDMMVSEYDLAPTIYDYAGLNKITITNTPGKSFAALLKSQPFKWENHDAVFMEQEAVRSVRTKQWLYVKRVGIHFDELYNLEQDPNEENNLIDNPTFAAIKATLNSRLDAFFSQYSNPKYNLWKGGTEKSNSDVPYIWKKMNPNWQPVVDTNADFNGN